jgi:hexosaminidase
MQLVPYPQRVTPRPGALELTRHATIRLLRDDPEARPALQLIDSGLSRIGCLTERTAEQTATLTLGIDPRLPLEAQGYRLSVEDHGATLIGRDPAGLYYAAATLLQWVTLATSAATGGSSARAGTAMTCRPIPAVQIEDWPHYPQRGVLLDISRDKVPTMETLELLVERLAAWKINQLQLYTEHTFAYAGHEQVWREASPMLPQQIRDLDRFCRQRFIELVPNQNSFGHFHRWLVHPRYRALAECPDGIAHPFSDVVEPFSLCPTDPGSIALLSDLYTQLLPNFSSKRFNVGLDETLDLGEGRSAAECRRDGPEEVYLRFLEQVHRLVEQNGRWMQFWGDIVIKHPELLSRLPENVTVLEWGYEPDHPFDDHLTHLQAAGVPFYVCPGTSSWNSFSGRSHEALLNIEAAARSGRAHGADGLLVADWGDNGHLQPLTSSFVGLLGGAAASWNVDRCLSHRTIARILDRHVFQDPKEHTGAATTLLGSTHRACGALRINGTALFSLLLSPADPLTHKRYRGLSRDGLQVSRDQVQQALALLAQARPDCPDAAIVSRELDWVAETLLFACDVGQARLAIDRAAPLEALNGSIRRRLAEQLETLLARHESVWLARNRPGGRLDSSGRLAKLLEQLRTP